MTRSGRLAGKIALVTGAASGLGLAIATRFVEAGATVILSDRDQPAARRAASELGASGCVLDTTDEEAWQAAASYTERQFGGLHILVNNAGICVTGTVEDTSLAKWRETHAVNLDGVFLGCKTCLPLISKTTSVRDEWGSILNISSISAMVAAANFAAYNSSKAAVRHFTKSVALHCAREKYRVTCNSVHPSFINTPLLDGFAPDQERATVIAKLARQIPARRIGEPDDVAFAAVYLCSDEARFVTGAELNIDGGIAAA